MRLDRYPAVAAAAIRQFASVVPRWARASGLDPDDVRQEIAAAALQGLNPATAVPVALGLRRLSTGWHSKDPAIAARLAGCIVDESTEIACEQREPVLDTTGLATALIGGTEAVARRSGIGRRAAQLRMVKQLQRFEAAGDLFGGATP